MFQYHDVRLIILRKLHINNNDYFNEKLTITSIPMYNIFNSMGPSVTAQGNVLATTDQKFMVPSSGRVFTVFSESTSSRIKMYNQ